MQTTKNVHTEHCCSVHGCKYGEKDCPVALGLQKQSYPCEFCGEDDLKDYYNDFPQRLGATETEGYKNGYNPHPTHCCKKHGCKYGYDDCPVYIGKEKQEYPCEECHMDMNLFDPVQIIDENERLKKLLYLFICTRRSLSKSWYISEVSIRSAKDFLVVTIRDFLGDHLVGRTLLPLEDFKKWYRKNYINL